MKWPAALLGSVWLSACFPHYDVPSAGSSGGAGGQAGSSGIASAAGTAPTPDPSCKDGERNGSETGIDCGMTACSKPCPVGQGCEANVDCEGGKCADKVCQAASCKDGLQNADESDLDCGGEQGCDRCAVGDHCVSSSDCDGGACTTGQCRAPTCKDELQNADETDKDCGGPSCLPCGVGFGCNATADCDGVSCVKQKCQAAACGDGVLNQDETDLDCGGSCSTACDDGKHCKIGADCGSGVCPKATLRCAAPTCTDGVTNGSEPAIDCGGSCPSKCEVLAGCASGADCKSTSCVDNVCVPLTATGEVLSPAKWVVTVSHHSSNTTGMEALDGSQSTFWITGADQTPGMFFIVDMAETQVFFSLEIDCNDPLDAAQSIDISVSKDDKFSQPAVITSFGTGANTVITFQKAQVGRYLKISLAQGKNRWWRMDELRVKQ